MPQPPSKGYCWLIRPLESSGGAQQQPGTMLGRPPMSFFRVVHSGRTSRTARPEENGGCAAAELWCLNGTRSAHDDHCSARQVTKVTMATPQAKTTMGFCVFHVLCGVAFSVHVPNPPPRTRADNRIRNRDLCLRYLPSHLDLCPQYQARTQEPGPENNCWTYLN